MVFGWPRSPSAPVGCLAPGKVSQVGFAGRLEISASLWDQRIPGMASSSVSEKADSFSAR